MNANEAIQAALHALDRTDIAQLDPALVTRLRNPLSDGERALFDRALDIKKGYEDLNGRVLRSAVFAEASLGTAAFIHELRQCLSPLIGLSELVKETPDSPYVGEWVGEISTQARRLADLLDRHAALMRTHASEEEPCDVAAVIAEASRYFTRLPPGVKLQIDAPAALPRAIARRRQLLHALINLLANARDAHKGRPGVIQVSARTLKDQTVEVIISDQGSGVPRDIRGRLFEPLFTTKAEDGTGLGLFLSRELLKPGGELILLDEAETPSGAKTAFAIRLPREGAASAVAATNLSEAVKQAPSPDDPYAQAKARARDRVSAPVAEERNNPVLLVEDEPAVRRMTRAVLESVANIKIYEAADAAFALKLLEKLQVDFLVCDKNLPDQDGLEVIRKAREHHSRIDAMIVTGYPSPESAAEAIRVGATDYLLKPVREVKMLRESVSSALSRQKLHRLAERHEAVWLELARELASLAQEPEAKAIFDRTLEHFERPSKARPRCAVAIQEELQRWVTTAQVDVIPVRNAVELAAVKDDLDVVVFPAEISPELARELLEAARGRTNPPHLVGVGRYLHTETAVAAIQGRTGVLIDRGIPPNDLSEKLEWAAARRRRETRAEALRGFLRELGFTL